MIFKIGKNHSILIGHLNKMGNLNDILLIGNSYRRKETWEFIQEVEIKYGVNPNWEIPILK
ncbi:hypothetical protein MNB_SV-9-1055 [hydrothermal vent metagenome]|uniref:Uncharacterized protein n=1 Tax=hydrothermal vent metagenome TaxID=652676 RepID=A0A1W1BBS3_9ZZZZ